MDDTGQSPSNDWTRRVDALVLLLAIGILIAIPLRIMAYGFLPPDDALRHAAKAVADRPWPDIILMRPDLQVDHHVGWHHILGWLHRTFGWDADGLVAFALVLMPCSVLLSGLLDARRRPECWLASWLLASIFMSPIMRLMLARPFVLSMGMLIVTLIIWTREDLSLRWRTRALLAALPLALATWIHGSIWYLFPIVIAAFSFARRWKETAGIFVSWIIGTLAGAALTGEPWTFLSGHLRHAIYALGGAELSRQLVGEFQPTEGLAIVVLFTACLLVIRRIARGREVWSELWRDPVFMTCILGWLLSLRVTRFWIDWGMPAYILWLARELNALTADAAARRPLGRLALAGASAVGLFWICTSDVGGRWTNNLTREYLESSNPRLAGWLPDPGGIFYNDDMGLFYQTFYANPHAQWKYALAYEAALMPADDLKIYRKIQWNYHADECFAPWVAKMKAEDRLVLPRSRSAPPAIPELEWLYGASGIWIGRLPVDSPKHAAGTPPDVPAKAHAAVPRPTTSAVPPHAP